MVFVRDWRDGHRWKYGQKVSSIGPSIKEQLERPPMSDAPLPPPPASVTVNLLFLSGVRKAVLLDKSSTVSDIVDHVESDASLEKPPGHTTAAIYRGRILSPTDRIDSLDSLSEFSVHIVFRQSSPAATDDDPNVRGFDRLRQMHYDERQIDAIRREFHEVRGSAQATDEERLTAEDEWLPVIFVADNIRHAGTRRTGDAATAWMLLTGFVVGVVTGLIFGPISLVLLLVSPQNRGCVFGLLLGLIVYYSLSTYSEVVGSIRVFT
jgi:hypothetical protein